MTCPSCGTITAGGAQRCPRCGGSLAAPAVQPTTPIPIVRAPTNRGELAQKAAGIVTVSLVPPARTPQSGQVTGQPAPHRPAGAPRRPSRAVGPAPAANPPAASSYGAPTGAATAPAGSRGASSSAPPYDFAEASHPAPSAGRPPALSGSNAVTASPAATPSSPPPSAWPPPSRAPSGAPAADPVGWAHQPPPPPAYPHQAEAPPAYAAQASSEPTTTAAPAPSAPTTVMPHASGEAETQVSYAPPSYAPPSYAPPEPSAAHSSGRPRPAPDADTSDATRRAARGADARDDQPGEARHPGRATVDAPWPPPPGPWTSGRPASES